MNGAHALIETLVHCGVDTCFANPGTSEMQLVSAIDKIPGMRPILALFEGVVTGAADGYARMAGKPACTLLHLGPGLANGVANLHNARKAGVPIVNCVGDHATYHLQYDAPLTSDLAGIARPVSAWLERADSPAALARLGAAAVAAAGGVPGQIATLMVPADAAWSALPDNYTAPAMPARRAPPAAAGEAVDAASRALHAARRPVLLLGGEALYGTGLLHAGRASEACGARLYAETFNRRIERGEGRVPVSLLPYFGERVLETLAGVDLIVLAGARTPVAFFGYPNRPSRLVPPGCEVISLVEPASDVPAALAALADTLGAGACASRVQERHRLPAASGRLDGKLVARCVARNLPEGAIVIDEAITNSLAAQQETGAGPAHDWLQLTGGSIGAGLPLAVGAAVAVPDRKVICLEGDGSAMYTVQSLWTMARERLDVINVIYANRSYAILNIELERVGAGTPGPRALSMLDMGNPVLRFAELARSLGVNAVRVETAEEFDAAFASMLRERGPHLIEAVI